MVQSMTGYGAGDACSKQYQITVEAKSVNHRFLEVVIRQPKQLSAFEDSIKKMIQSSFKRGRFEVFVTLTEIEKKKPVLVVDNELALAYYKSLIGLAESCGLPGRIQLADVADFPGVLSVEKPEPELEEIWLLVSQALTIALADLSNMRQLEGQRLADDLCKRSQLIAAMVDEILLYSPTVVADYQSKLQQRIDVLLAGIAIDQSKLANEVAFFADHCDITEEITRLKSHGKQFHHVFSEDDSLGRKLEFILQEMNREVNTIGSKANDLKIAQLVIEAKSELEKMREQVQNLE